MTNNPIGWFEIYVQDMSRARAFYESVFATSLERLEGPDIEMWAFGMQPDRPGAAGALVRMEGFHPAATARSSTSLAQTVLLRPNAHLKAAARSSRTSFP
jgi:predicted enzyme related to lactoylglutathione lyase